MSVDEALLLRLGDYVKCSLENKSDEYFMVTCVADGFKLRHIGNKKLITIKTAQELENYIKINTNRA